MPRNNELIYDKDARFHELLPQAIAQNKCVYHLRNEMHRETKKTPHPYPICGYCSYRLPTDALRKGNAQQHNRAREMAAMERRATIEAEKALKRNEQIKSSAKETIARREEAREVQKETMDFLKKNEKSIFEGMKIPKEEEDEVEEEEVPLARKNDQMDVVPKSPAPPVDHATQQGFSDIKDFLAKTTSEIFFKLTELSNKVSFIESNQVNMGKTVEVLNMEYTTEKTKKERQKTAEAVKKRELDKLQAIYVQENPTASRMDVRAWRKMKGNEFKIPEPSSPTQGLSSSLDKLDVNDNAEERNPIVNN